jgi:hypothetical protein
MIFVVIKEFNNQSGKKPENVLSYHNKCTGISHHEKLDFVHGLAF